MHNKLDQLSLSADEDDTCPDTSLLSPEDQDWVSEMCERIGQAENAATSGITEPEARKFIDMLNALPWRGPSERREGPSFDIPLTLERRFRGFNLSALKVVQKVRFVELCRRYGWEGHYPHPDRHGAWKYRDPVSLVPLTQWEPDDEAELRALLDAAEKGFE
jgi:hypothetical protein